MDPRLGRAQQMIIFDTETKTIEVLDNNEGIAAAHGAGINMAQMMSDKKADAIITGQCGPKALNALTVAKIKVYNTDIKTVSEAIDAYMNGALEQINSVQV